MFARQAQDKLALQNVIADQDEAEHQQFLAAGAPNLLGALRQLSLMGVTIDPNGKFAERLAQYEKDIEAATNGDFDAYLRMHKANGTTPSAKDIAAFLANGGPPVAETLRQRVLMGKWTNPDSVFGRRAAALEALFDEEMNRRALAEAGVQPRPEPGARGPAQNVPAPVQDVPAPAGAGPIAVHDDPGLPQFAPWPAVPDQPKPAAAPVGEVRQVVMGFGVGVVGQEWHAWGSYDGVTLTITTEQQHPDGSETTTRTQMTGEAAARAFAAAQVEQDRRDADYKAAQDAQQAAKDQAAKDRADGEAQDDAKNAAQDAAENAGPEPDPNQGEAYVDPDAANAGGRNPIPVDDAGPPGGPAGRQNLGGDYGNPLYVEFVGGGLLLRVSAGPDRDPNADHAGQNLGVDDGGLMASGPAGRLPFGGDFGNPQDRDDPGAAGPPQDNGIDPYI